MVFKKLEFGVLGLLYIALWMCRCKSTWQVKISTKKNLFGFARLSVTKLQFYASEISRSESSLI